MILRRLRRPGSQISNSSSWLGHFKPTWQQAAYALLVAVLVSLLWCRDQILQALTSGTQLSASDLNAGFVQVLTRTGNHQVLGIVALVLFWGLTGLAIAAIIYESVNLLITAWDDYVIVSTYTGGASFRRQLVKTFVLRLLVAAVFGVLVILSWKVTFSTWHDLISQPAAVFWQPARLGREILGLVGLTANIYVLWMGGLLVAPQLFGSRSGA